MRIKRKTKKKKLKKGQRLISTPFTALKEFCATRHSK